MKKIMFVILAGLLIIGCSKTEPKEEPKAEMVTSSVEEPEMVAGASYLPDFEEEAEADLEEDPVPVVLPEEPEEEPVAKTTPKKTKPVYTQPKKVKPLPAESIPEPSEDEVAAVMETDVQEKIAVDEESTKVVTEVEVLDEPAAPEKKTPMGLIAAIAAIAIAAVGYFATRGKG